MMRRKKFPVQTFALFLHSRSRKAPIPPTERGNFTEPKAQIEVTHEGRDSNLASSVSPHYNFSEIECFDTMLARGTPLEPRTKEMRKIAEIEPHNRYMQIRLTEAEYEAIERKFRNSGLRSRSEFIRTMIFEGYIVNFDEEKFDKIYRLVGSIANNINQIAVRVNSTNKVYAEDIVNIKEGQDKIWQLLNSLQSKLLRLKR